MPFKGCALRRITGCPKAPNHGIWGAQPSTIMQKMSFSSRPKTKVSSLRPLGTARAQPCFISIHLICKKIFLHLDVSTDNEKKNCCHFKNHIFLSELVLSKRGDRDYLMCFSKIIEAGLLQVEIRNRHVFLWETLFKCMVKYLETVIVIILVVFYDLICPDIVLLVKYEILVTCYLV